MKQWVMSRPVAWLLACWLLAACTGEKGLLPPSGGRLYEVLLVGDREGLVRQMLEADVEGLPQSEPSFDVSDIDNEKFGASLRQARNIIVVSIDPKTYGEARVGYEKNVWAKPQMVIHVGAPSASVLRRSAVGVAATLRTLLNRSEANKNIALLRNNRNTKAEKAIRQMFGVSMWIPVDMVACKRGKDFVWLSNNGVATMQNIVVYTAPSMAKHGVQATGGLKEFVAWRNQVMKQNIMGETDSMWMTTVGASVSKSLVFRNDEDRNLWLRRREEAHAPMILFRGLWEMRGDDMGGPFVSRLLSTDTRLSLEKERSECVVAEGFVFAPGKSKRNAIRRLEAVLYTLQWDKP